MIRFILAHAFPLGYLLFMSEVTQILNAIEQGNPQAAEQLLPLVYDELRKLAAQKLALERPGQTLEATALVHEAYLRLVRTPVRSDNGADNGAEQWNSRGHFFAAAAEAMRRILTDIAREKLSLKRGGDWIRRPLEEVTLSAGARPEELLALDDALERLTSLDPTAGQLVQLRYFAGLTVEQAAKSLNVAVPTAYRHWKFARAWLHSQISS